MHWFISSDLLCLNCMWVYLKTLDQLRAEGRLFPNGMPYDFTAEMMIDLGRFVKVIDRYGNYSGYPPYTDSGQRLRARLTDGIYVIYPSQYVEVNV